MRDGWCSGVADVPVVDCGAHLLNKLFVAVFRALFETAVEAVVLAGFEDVLSIGGFSDEIGIEVGIFNGMPFRIDNIGEEGEAMGSFFLAEIFRAARFNFFRSGDGDGGIGLPRHPNTLLWFEIKIYYGRKICFHRLIFFKWQSEDPKEDNEWDWNNDENWKNLEQNEGNSNKPTGNHEVDKLAEAKRTDKLIVGFHILRDLILGHTVILP